MSQKVKATRHESLVSQMKEYNVKNILLQKSCRKWV